MRKMRKITTTTKGGKNARRGEFAEYKRPKKSEEEYCSRRIPYNNNPLRFFFSVLSPAHPAKFTSGQSRGQRVSRLGNQTFSKPRMNERVRFAVAVPGGANLTLFPTRRCACYSFRSAFFFFFCVFGIGCCRLLTSEFHPKRGSWSQQICTKKRPGLG